MVSWRALRWLSVHVVVGQEVPAVRLLHITDSHISLSNEAPPRSSRMHAAFARSRNRDTKQPTTPAQEFSRLLALAREMSVDLVVLGGDVMNFPSNTTAAWILQELSNSGQDFIFTSGNHDWHLEGQQDAPSYDHAREAELLSTFRPFFELGASSRGSCYEGLAGPGLGFLYGCTVVKGLLVLFVDNSNFQVDAAQLEFTKVQLARAGAAPVVVLLHIPLMLPGSQLPPKELCGHDQWGTATDQLWQVEGRPKWPPGNLQSTLDFRELLKLSAAPYGPVVAVLAGHTHEDQVTALSSEDNSWTVVSETGRGEPSKASGALQYTTHTAAEGAYRLLTIY